MRIRIIKVPPASKLEGIDLRPYKLQQGEVLSLKSPIAAVLIAWGYAESVEPAARPSRKLARDRKR